MPPRNRLSRAELEVVTWDRRTFFDEIFDYTPGDHCTFLAPYGGGKTQIAFQALEVTASPKMQATIFVMKPKDVTVERFMRDHPKRWPLVRDWPPPKVTLGRVAFGEKYDGYVLWPKETGNLHYDEQHQGDVFATAIQDMYLSAKKQANIMFVDETYSLENELKLSAELRRAWTKGRSVGNGLWAASQRPANISQYAYQAQHLFLGQESDARALDRYAEIGGGFDPEVIKSLIHSLKRYEFLYISREERALCIVGAS
jgi:hypothetical protein